MTLCDELRARVNCPVLAPGDAGFDAAREIWNALYDRTPAAIVQCDAAGSVAAAVKFAADRGVPAAVKAGGHHVAGHASIEGGILLDLTGMRGMEIDPAARTVSVQSGLTWAHFDPVTQAFGLASTGPIVSMTGVAGFTLGGGFGWLHRKCGLSCDNLRRVELVSAAGEKLVASESENPDLFWAIRGSGWNFGVVTRMEFGLHAIGPMVTAGLIYFPLDEMQAVVSSHRALAAEFPDELTSWFFLRLAPPVPVIPREWVGRPVMAIAFCHCGSPEDGARWAARLAQCGPAIVNTTAQVEYRNWQRSLDGRWGNGFCNDWRGHYLSELTEGAVTQLMDGARRIESPWTDIKIVHLEGAVSRIAEAATAFGNRAAKFGLVIQARWENPAESERHLAWARGLRDQMAEHGTGGVYANFIAEDEPHRVAAAHGAANYRRLQQLKAKYDPANLFRANVNVTPEA